MSSEGVLAVWAVGIVSWWVIGAFYESFCKYADWDPLKLDHIDRVTLVWAGGIVWFLTIPWVLASLVGRSLGKRQKRRAELRAKASAEVQKVIDEGDRTDWR